MTNQTTDPNELENISDDPMVQELIANMAIEPKPEVKVDEKDPSKEGNPVTPEISKSEGEDVVKDSVNAGQPDTSNKDVQAEISKAVSGATEKHMKLLEEVVKKLSKEELAELEEGNPQLFNRLRNSVPEVFKEEEVLPTKNKAERLEKLIEQMVTAQEENAFDEWRQVNDIAKEDYVKTKQDFEETARTLYELPNITDFAQALKLAGEIHFPHLSGKPVDTEKLAKIQGQRVTVSNMAPSSRGGEFSDEDFQIMRREKMTEDEYRSALRGEFILPGTL